DGIRDRNVTGVQTCALPISVSKTTGHGANPTVSEQNHRRWSKFSDHRATFDGMEQKRESMSNSTWDGAIPTASEQFQLKKKGVPLSSLLFSKQSIDDDDFAFF